MTLGVAEPVDLIVEFNRSWGTTTTAGIDTAEPDSADFKLSTKLQFLKSGGFSAAIRPDIGYSYLPSGNSRDNAQFYGGVLIASQQLEPITLTLNLGYLYYDYQSPADRDALRSNLWSGSLAAIWQATQDLQLVADIGTGTNPDRGSRQLPTFTCGGIIYSLTDYLDIAGGFKIGLNKPETDLMLQSAVVLKF